MSGLIMTRYVALLLMAIVLLPTPALAQVGTKSPVAPKGQPQAQLQVQDPARNVLPRIDGLDGLGDNSVTSRIVQMAAVLTLISVAPALLIMLTSFTRFLIAFSFLRTGLGLQGAPANLVFIALALFMTFYVMAPAFDRAWENGAKPLIEKQIGEQEAFARIIEPFSDFMRANVREKDLKMFDQLATERMKSKPDGVELQLRILIPAFIVSELRRGFEIGFLILLPFLVIDLIVATLVMAMVMMMLSPTVFSLPCKVLFFVLIDGWNILVHGLVRSFV